MTFKKRDQTCTNSQVVARLTTRVVWSLARISSATGRVVYRARLISGLRQQCPSGLASQESGVWGRGKWNGDNSPSVVPWKDAGGHHLASV